MSRKVAALILLLALISISIVAYHIVTPHREIMIRCDDVYEVSDDLIWLVNLSEQKDCKLVFGVIPGVITDNSTIEYLRGLDRSRVELAVHGYKHEDLESLTYEQQYKIIKNATDSFTKMFYKPEIFIAPYNHANADTITICKSLGYKEVSANPDVNFSWEVYYTGDRVGHRSIDEFKQVLNRAGGNRFIMVFHHRTFHNNATLHNNIIESIVLLKEWEERRLR